MQFDFSVLMSLYFKEAPQNFRECMNSILSQTVLPDEIVIVKDGPLTTELESVLAEYVERAPDLYRIVPLETNRGLGLALAEGIRHCTNELVARMDTDDIARSDRFEKQLAEFKKDPELDICGSHIVEFEGAVENVVAHRKVPLEDAEIKRYQKRRDSFNHMTVMYKRSMVLKAGNYQSCLLMEDTLLWVHMIMAGAKCKNIDDTLVYARIGSGMFERRGGFSYYRKYKQGRKRVRQTGYIGFFDYYYTLLVQLCVAMMPNKLRGLIFKKMLHGE
ncbi:MAG: glycosyltransferase [Ruminococcaceae bacterium]|nr:glycosyltransferase [Oscillospiraceae bacterium]